MQLSPRVGQEPEAQVGRGVAGHQTRRPREMWRGKRAAEELRAVKAKSRRWVHTHLLHTQIHRAGGQTVLSFKLYAAAGGLQGLYLTDTRAHHATGVVSHNKDTRHRGRSQCRLRTQRKGDRNTQGHTRKGASTGDSRFPEHHCYISDLGKAHS